jgi:hypothetical protein
MKGAKLTPRDHHLVQCLFDYGILSSHQIARWFFHGVAKTTVLRRLRRLSDGEFIRKRGSTPDGTAVYTVDKEGARAIGEEPRITTYPYHQIVHELTLNDIRKRLAELRVTKYWMTERRYREELIRMERLERGNPSRRIIPDAVAIFRHFEKPDAKVKIELELHLKSNLRYKARFHHFGPFVEKPMHFYWYFVKTEAVGNKILRLCKAYGDFEGEKYIGYTVIDDLLANGANARLVQLKTTRLLRDVMKIEQPTPAQVGAYPLSREKQPISNAVAS